MLQRGKSKLLVFGLVIFMLLGAACGGGDGGESGEAADAGQALFEQSVLEGQAGCVTCHSREPGTVLVGPSLANIGNEAGERSPDVSAQEYLHQSILQPDTYVVEGFPSGTMPKVWGDVLSEEQVNQLISYLLTLKQ